MCSQRILEKMLTLVTGNCVGLVQLWTVIHLVFTNSCIYSSVTYSKYSYLVFVFKIADWLSKWARPEQQNTGIPVVSLMIPFCLLLYLKMVTVYNVETFLTSTLPVFCLDETDCAEASSITSSLKPVKVWCTVAIYIFHPWCLRFSLLSA